MHFNRDGVALNDKAADIYDLTRVQPAAYWYTNHLLMKIRGDTGQEMKFVIGDKKRAADWETVKGAAEFIENRIALTSEPSANGLLVLRDSERYGNIELKASLKGNVVGSQAIYARYDGSKDSFVRVAIDNNVLSIEQKKPGQAVEQLLQSELDEVSWKETDLALNKATVYSQLETSTKDLTEESQYPVNIGNTRKVGLVLRGNKLTVTIDGKAHLQGKEIDASIASGSVALESRFNEQNKKDLIYDGVFEDVKINALQQDGETGEQLYSNRFAGMEKLVSETKRRFNSTIDWMIDSF
jgi:hypothetical protein